MRWARRSVKTFWCRNMRNFCWWLAFSCVLCHGTVVAQTSTAATPTPSVSTSTSSTATKKPVNTGVIYRWVDRNGKVQYSADVPEDRRSSARKVDTRSNIVSSQVPARVEVTPPTVQATDTPPQARAPVTAREKCEADWQAYRAAQACFAQYRQGAGGSQGKAGGSYLRDEASTNCPNVPEPAPCR